MAELLDFRGLSTRQREFADRMGCRLVTRCADGAVCLYRVIAHETVRWIVDADGSVVDWAVFRSSP
ncbi:MAG TPA: hypothetical protein VFN36_00235, partial [Solirubrobacteraceae bacterium]|nr:hypothetical protein [Solirubrobacteraceae bacterium]